MIIFLVEPSHTGHGRSPNTVPLAAGYLAAMVRKHFPSITVRIFRDPQLLLEEARKTPPDILGISVYLWSEQLAAFLASNIKQFSDKTVIVAGGASIDDIDEELRTFLYYNPYYDICVPNQGEMGFVRIIEHIEKHGGLVRNTTIEGCAQLSEEGELLRGHYAAPNLADIPSPYLEGLLDSFLEDGYVPVIQSMRGCPYSCAFCVSGSSNWGKIGAFDLERVFAEIEYVKARTRSAQLLLTDENLGILKERDVTLAEYIINSHQAAGYPSQLYYYTAKIITEHVLRIVEILSPIGAFGISFQTLNEKARREIKRTNIEFRTLTEYVGWAKERKIATSTEMIFGFPGETVESYIEGIERLVRSGVDYIFSYNLRLFNGIDLASRKSREKYGYQTKFRLPERTYGTYDGTVITELEEVVVGTSSFDFDDYLTIRKVGLFLELASGRGYLTELIQLLIMIDLPGEKIIHYFARHPFDRFPTLAAIIRDYEQRAKDELFDSAESCTDMVRSVLRDGKPVPEVKLNFIFIGKIILNDDARREFFSIIKEFIARYDSGGRLEFASDYLNTVLDNQIIRFSPSEPSEIAAYTKINFSGIANSFRGTMVPMMHESRAVTFHLNQLAAEFMKERTGVAEIPDDTLLQNIYMSLPVQALQRTRRIH